MSDQEQPIEPQTGPLSAEQAAALIADLEAGGEYQPKDEGRSEEEVREATEAEKRAPPPEQRVNAEVQEQEPEEEIEDAAPPEKATSSEEESETEEEPEEELPSLDPPRSWSKTDKDTFRTLPRDAQERILEVDESREREVRRIQNEAAEKQRAFEAELQQLEQARQRYESALPQVASMLNSELATKFPDIRTQDDLIRLAQTDTRRWAEFQTLAQKQQAIAQEKAYAEQQQQSQLRDQYMSYAQEQDAKFLEAAPEWAKPEEAEKLQKQAVGVLEDIGFSREEIQAAWTGGVPLSARDHRFQLLLRDAVRYRQGQRAAATAKAKPAVKVTKPGTSSTKAEVNQERLQSRIEKLRKTGSTEDAVAALLERGFD